MNYVLVFRPEVREELNDAHSWYESQKASPFKALYLQLFATALNYYSQDFDRQF